MTKDREKLHFPMNFSYLIEKKVAASAHPGRGEALGRILATLRDEGFGAILSVVESPLDSAMLREFGLESLHIDVSDFTAPTLDQIDRAMHFIKSQIEADGRVLVHCFGGYGRTGTILACYLVAEGHSAEEAIRIVRASRPGSIEIPEQERVVHTYERLLRNSGARSDRESGA